MTQGWKGKHTSSPGPQPTPTAATRARQNKRNNARNKSNHSGVANRLFFLILYRTVPHCTAPHRKYTQPPLLKSHVNPSKKNLTLSTIPTQTPKTLLLSPLAN
jgi:hypothetical protein